MPNECAPSYRGQCKRLRSVRSNLAPAPSPPRSQPLADLVGDANQAAPREQRDEQHQESDTDQAGRAGLKVVLIDEQQDGGSEQDASTRAESADHDHGKEEKQGVEVENRRRDPAVEADIERSHGRLRLLG